ncbi:hypothetical protein MUK42_11897 [Musa troglodytarum]|uniref:Uncharacterized protein n=1 Tax=Musa troglodytarum TaxID=320322 RepID=A0A9E7I195_9LILI|nr:hypothetical protein MUK42_11897 [Musa troglodytarum]
MNASPSPPVTDLFDEALGFRRGRPRRGLRRDRRCLPPPLLEGRPPCRRCWGPSFSSSPTTIACFGRSEPDIRDRPAVVVRNGFQNRLFNDPGLLPPEGVPPLPPPVTAKAFRDLSQQVRALASTARAAALSSWGTGGLTHETRLLHVLMMRPHDTVFTCIPPGPGRNLGS